MILIQNALEPAKIVAINPDGTVGPELRSNPVAFQAWVDGGGDGAMPMELAGVVASGSIGGKYIINGKIYEKKNITEDFSYLNLADHGIRGVDSWANVRSAESTNYLYAYWQRESTSEKKVTWIDRDNSLNREILETHIVTEMQVSNDDTLLICGTNIATGFKETVLIKNANTEAPSTTITSGCSSIAQAP